MFGWRLGNNSFTIQVADRATAIERAREAVVQHGGFFDGDEQTGRFSGQGVEGNYTTVDAGFLVVIIRKPFFTSYSYIEQTIRGFFA